MTLNKGAILMNQNQILRVPLAVLLAVSALVTPLRAQTPASTFEELRANLKLKEKETIQITEDNGAKYNARVASISGQTLTITAKGIQRDLTESQVREIRHRRPDKWWNGMLIGLGAGVAATVVGVTTACGSNDPECDAIATAVFLPAFAGIGMGAGAAIDFAIKKHETVFARSSSTTSRSIRISPVLNKGNAGVRVAFGF
jgi:hypothetical protein